MKNKTQLCIAFLLSLTISTISFSQNLSFGIRGGLNIANLSVDAPPYYVNGGPNIDSKESRTSFNAGIYSQYSVNEKIALQAELFYSGEGVSFTNPGTEQPNHINLGYLSLPVFFKYSIVKNFYAMAGPQLSYLLAANCVYMDGHVYDAMDEHNKTAISLVPAIGYDWKNFSINLRYQLGVSKLPNPSSTGGYTRYIDDNVKSNVFAVVVSYKIFSIK